MPSTQFSAKTEILSSDEMKNIEVETIFDNNLPEKKMISRDDRTIMKNMEEVLNSIKKRQKHKHKHHHHHRRKEKTVKLSIDNDLVEMESNDINGAENDHQMNDVNILSALKSPSKENIAILVKNSRKRGPYKKKMKSESTGSKKDDKINDSQEVIAVEELELNKATENKSPVQKQIVKNAFEYMMNARNKSIGSNSPGKEEVSLINDSINEEKSKKKKQRNSFLEDWADRKGAKKRKLKDEEREEYIDHKLNQRAKRLKKMIENGNSSSQKEPIKSAAKSKIINGQKKSEVETVPITDNSEIEEIDLTSIVESKHESKSAKKKRKILTSPIDLDAESVEFVAKLSSPTKKRDSLLGYFPKAVTPNNDSIELPKKGKSKKDGSKENVKKTKEMTNVKEPETESIANSEVTNTPNGRPRRSCTIKTSFDHDLSAIDDNKVKPKTKSKKISVENSRKSEIISLDKRVENNNLINCEEPKKLAPLFIKTVPKPIMDPKIVEARQAFLMSGVPDKIKQEQAKRKQIEENYQASVELFPKISHVSNHVNVDNRPIDWGNCGITWRHNDNQIDLVKDSKKLKNITECNAKDYAKPKTKLLPMLLKLPLIDNKRDLVKLWKNKFEKFPTYKCYNQLREKYRYFSAKDTALDTQQVAESFVVTTRSKRRSFPQLDHNDDLNDKPPDSAPNGELLFTEKYKAMSSDQVLVNLTPLNTLKEFLMLWKDDGRNATRLGSSTSDFQNENDSFSSSTTTNTIVLLGPNSSGKTQSVFALADELNFNVLEINAGMKRTGKKILQELQEATQSHQIRKETKDNLLKKSLNGRKKKNMIEINSDGTISNDLNETVKMSLILVEDGDLLFEQHDGGFVDAIYQLASISKRPVIVTANNPNCQHLMRLINENSVEFRSPNAVNISRFLSVLSLIENCPIEIEDITNLYMYNNKDLRKTILEMQFFIQSGGDRRNDSMENQKQQFFASPTKRLRSISHESNEQFEDESILRDENSNNNLNHGKFSIHKSLFQLYTSSQNCSTFIPNPVNMNLLWTNLCNLLKSSENIANKNKLSGEIETENSISDKFLEFYENVSVASNLRDTEEITDRLQHKIEEDIVHYLVEGSVRNILNVNKFPYNLLYEQPTERVNLSSKITNTMWMRSSKSRLLDYESVLRSICRNEKSRSESLDRRNSRFYHYLRNISQNMNTFSSEFFDDACSVLIEH